MISEMKPIKCRAILFDLDGTLLDTLTLKVQNAARVFEELFQWAPIDVELAYRRYSGIPRRQLFNAIAVATGHPPLDDQIYDQVSMRFTELNRNHIGSESVFPDVPLALTELRRMGFILIVSSSATPDDVSSALQASGLTQYLDEFLGSGGSFNKGPEHVLYVCKNYGLEPSRVCVVGDEPADFLLARKSGAHCVARIGTLAKSQLQSLAPDAVVNNLTELLSMIRIE